MRGICKDILVSLQIGIIFPAMLLSYAVSRTESTKGTAPVFETEEVQTVYMPMLLQKDDGSVEEMNLDEYLTGVVLAEMPASFEPEALKAQAVAARTFTRKAYETGGKHGNGSTCTDPGCCQAYCSPENYLQKGGTQEDLEKVRQAVQETSGMVLCYEGKLIEATYYSCSGGRTEDAAEVWGTDYPYLVSVNSPGEEEASGFEVTSFFSAEEFQRAIEQQLKGTPDSWISETEYTSGGGVASMRIGEKVYAGTELRKCLGLRSTMFRMSARGDGIAVVTRGSGHRVGMSQYGADAMAASGSGYAEILAHYYPGTVLMEIGESS